MRLFRMGFLEKIFIKRESTVNESEQIKQQLKSEIKNEIKDEIRQELVIEQKKNADERKHKEVENSEELPYIRKLLLSSYEYKFYKIIKPIADKYNLHILSKVRLIDFVGVKRGLAGNEAFGFISKIKQKHVDFLICNPDNLYPLAVIELDDSTHQSLKSQESDKFKNQVLSSAGIKIYRIINLNEDIEKIFQEIKASAI